MGIIKWGLQAARGVYEDQPKEIFTAQDMNNDVLAVPGIAKGKKDKVSTVITDGSVFNVGINQAALLIENGKVHDFVIADSEQMTGQYIYDTSLEPSLLTSGTKEWGAVWNTVKNRFSFGGMSPNTMNLVYINLKEITDNPVGVGKIPFVDVYLGTRLMMGVHGYYTFKISNPAVFYENLLMDPTQPYEKEELTKALKADLMPRIQSALAKIAPLCTNGYQDVYLHRDDITAALNEAVGKDWLEKRGVELVQVSLTPELSPADTQRVMELENAKTLSNADMAIGSMVNAQNQAMQSAGKNAAGAVTGFMGVQMAQNGTGGVQDLLQKKMEQQQQTTASAPVQQSADGHWTCANCGQEAIGKFCSNCGSPKPQTLFCSNCGQKLPEQAKFCPNCGQKV